MRNQFGVQTYSGALTIGSLMVMPITGPRIFFHINIAWVKLAEELVSWVFVVAATCLALVDCRWPVAYFRTCGVT